ncbi:translation initiation factor IF-2-like isoform X2 [Marmota marmota marmota]|uniref:translation initiation factor IF-2-like isoform X2 n=1 Tax=Marmota marmota marmota TaxID=9994 RepID=UPI0020920996|nr:translation initiation factor IF-2-like isoform X2 [Marmota marmota marmota]
MVPRKGRGRGCQTSEQAGSLRQAGKRTPPGQRALGQARKAARLTRKWGTRGHPAPSKPDRDRGPSTERKPSRWPEPSHCSTCLPTGCPSCWPRAGPHGGRSRQLQTPGPSFSPRRATGQQAARTARGDLGARGPAEQAKTASWTPPLALKSSLRAQVTWASSGTQVPYPSPQSCLLPCAQVGPRPRRGLASASCPPQAGTAEQPHNPTYRTPASGSWWLRLRLRPRAWPRSSPPSPAPAAPARNPGPGGGRVAPRLAWPRPNAFRLHELVPTWPPPRSWVSTHLGDTLQPANSSRGALRRGGVQGAGPQATGE